MIYRLGSKKVLLTSMITTLMLLCIVMFFANPLIDGQDGLGVVALQLSFEKEAGMALIRSWGPSGVEHFKRWIFTDYLYAASYSLFFASLLSLLMLKKGVADKSNYRWVVLIPFVAGLMDWVENTMEWFFLNSPQNFSNALFFIHSVIATIKWSALPIVLTYIIILLMRPGAEPMPTSRRTTL